jgi:hypothetical protein
MKMEEPTLYLFLRLKKVLTCGRYGNRCDCNSGSTGSNSDLRPAMLTDSLYGFPWFIKVNGEIVP